MLESAIMKLYRKFRDASRDRRATRLEEEARMYEVVGETYRVSLLLLKGFEANTAAKLLALRGAQKYERLARDARTRAANIRAGRRG
jgi:hypothetical protein